MITCKACNGKLDNDIFGMSNEEVTEFHNIAHRKAAQQEAARELTALASSKGSIPNRKLQELAAKLAGLERHDFVNDGNLGKGGKPNREWTFVLLRPDYAAGTFGHDTVCLVVSAPTAAEGLEAARKTIAEKDEQPEPDDYRCQFCAEGNLVNLQDGCGGVNEPVPTATEVRSQHSS